MEKFMGLWTREHLITIFPTFAILLILAFLMRKLLIKKSYKIRMLPIKIISVILVIIEIGKQAYSISIGYNLFHIPLHFCSIFLYVLPLFAFYRGKWQESVRSVASAAMTALLIGMLAIPNVIYSANRIPTFFTDFLSFHTVFFHNLVIFALFLTLALDLHKPNGERGEVVFVTVFGAVYAVIAASASYLLQTNYSNFLNSSIGFVAYITESMTLAIGETATKIIYTSAIALLHILLLVVTYYAYMALCIAKEKCLTRLSYDHKKTQWHR